MTNLDSIFKSRDITLPTKVRLVKAMVFPVVVYGCESWTVKKAEHQSIDAFELWCWRRLSRVPWTARRSNQSILKEISPGCSLEGMMLKLKLQYFGHLLWKILREMGIPDHLTCLLRNLYAGQEATVTTGHGTTDWFQIGKGVRQGCILSPCLFNFYAEYLMRNAGLEETQAGIKIAGRNTNKLRYADDTTLMAESEEELKSLLMKVNEESEKLA